MNVNQFEKLLPILASLITSAAVSFSGAIGFIGLMMPHIMRLLAGGIFLMWADMLARCLMEIPIGVITAIAETPFFIYLMRRGRSL